MEEIETVTRIAHEIRSPIATAAVAVKTLLSMENDESKIKILGIMEKNCEYALRMVVDILDLSQGRLKAKKDEVDVYSLVEGLAREYADKASVRGLRFQCNMDPSTPQVVSGDGDRIEQVLRNLLDNALKFTKEGEINFWVALLKDSSGLTFSVIDQADLIPEDKIETIFETGSRVGDLGVPGLGIGLPLCKKLAELMGGRITVKPAGGDFGNAFSLELGEC